LNPVSEKRKSHFLRYGLWVVFSLLIFWRPCLALFHYSLTNDNASHILLIPLICGWLIYLEQKTIFRQVSYDHPPALFAFAGAAILAIWTLRNEGNWLPINSLSAYITSLVMFLISGFLLFFGRGAAARGRFCLLFLFLTVPLPDALLNNVIYYLQKGSADVAELIFDVAGVPALREGFVFHLAHLSIEVAKECSGIRSSIALLVLALLVGHLFLRTFWKQALFVVLGLVIMIVKNGIRIATLTILAQYVDSSFLFGRLHHEGGIVFFVIGLLLLLPVFWLLQRGETRATAPAGGGNGPPGGLEARSTLE
jgi:exosortase